MKYTFTTILVVMCFALLYVGGKSVGAIGLHSIGENHPPLAQDDVFVASSGSSVELDVLKNDMDKDGDTLEIAAITSEQDIDIKVVNNRVLFTPKALNYTGVVKFSYTVTDSVLFDIAQVSLYISNAD